MLLNMVHLTIIFLEHFSTWFGSKYDYGSDFAILWHPVFDVTISL